MLKYLLAAATAAAAIAVAVPVASAQQVPFTASYNVKSTGLSGTPTCPDNEVVCGKGTSPQFGSFGYALVFGPGVINIVSLTFGDGVLVLDQTFESNTSPGASGDTAGARRSFGNPNNITSDWTVDTSDSSGIFAGLSSGSGTDVLHFAGIAGQGQISGVLGP